MYVTYASFKAHLDDASERLRCLRAMAATPILDRLSFTLDLIFTDYVRLQDFRSVIYYVDANPYGRPIAWNWFKNNWKWIADRYGKSRRIGQILYRLVRFFSSRAQLEVPRSFLLC